MAQFRPIASTPTSAPRWRGRSGSRPALPRAGSGWRSSTTSSSRARTCPPAKSSPRSGRSTSRRTSGSCAAATGSWTPPTSARRPRTPPRRADSRRSDLRRRPAVAARDRRAAVAPPRAAGDVLPHGRGRAPVLVAVPSRRPRPALALAPLLEPFGLAEHPRDRLPAAIAALPGSRRSALAADLERAARPDAARRTLDGEELRRLAGAGLRDRLSYAPSRSVDGSGEDELRAALRDGRDAARGGRGRAPDADRLSARGRGRRVAAEAAAAGFRLGFTTVPAPVRPTDDPLRLPRPEILAPAGRFALRLALLTQPFGPAGDYAASLWARRAIRTS